MDTRRKAVVATLLVLAGAALWFVVRSQMGPSERQWAAQIQQDALALTQVLRRDFRPGEKAEAEVDAAWAKRRPLYDAPHLAELGARLTAFVDFQVAEYADAKDIYLSGRDPAKPSTQALVAYDKLKQAFGADADVMISQFKDAVREAAFKASPKIGGEPDPDLPKYDAIYDDLVKTWLPQARARVERLTSPPR